MSVFTQEKVKKRQNKYPYIRYITRIFMLKISKICHNRYSTTIIVCSWSLE